MALVLEEAWTRCSRLHLHLNLYWHQGAEVLQLTQMTSRRLRLLS